MGRRAFGSLTGSPVGNKILARCSKRWKININCIINNKCRYDEQVIVTSGLISM